MMPKRWNLRKVWKKKMFRYGHVTQLWRHMSEIPKSLKTFAYVSYFNGKRRVNAKKEGKTNFIAHSVQDL